MRKRVSNKTYTKVQLNYNANLHNPNNKAYHADIENQCKNQKSNRKKLTDNCEELPTSMIYYG